mmetsp:Transcript_19119/g.57735  ORF Transcript_19119/g.57735 Transcript_19119/m.57735 type:complete len:157 (-) Transcript_19119:644-1114(-)|eukprot:CAMPEP_0206144638 /NCGR_PEP_ID=MMETSP1473-20131121/24687_1 /ASSEMBLY_ACC=CAM_ASM_001109 /TAXON_ID=1461547 /ORGANISM="Stichococcus sp, Strain RCC1054" /LENGTH=156 /DNA_ID=CAMNT_0053540503 /DNA_START=351 /DNA_END=821 /DNA_ORIENTATION=-
MSKEKTVAQVIKLVINAGQAKPGPPVGAALGQAGLKIMEFVKDFNAKTADIKPEIPMPVVITAYSDKTFDFEIKTPPTSWFIKQAAGITTGSQRPGHSTAGTITSEQVFEIATMKLLDKPELSIYSLCKNIIGTCRSMGVHVAPPENSPEQQPPPS